MGQFFRKINGMLTGARTNFQNAQPALEFNFQNIKNRGLVLLTGFGKGFHGLSGNTENGFYAISDWQYMVGIPGVWIDAVRTVSMNFSAELVSM